MVEKELKEGLQTVSYVNYMESHLVSTQPHPCWWLVAGPRVPSGSGDQRPQAGSTCFCCSQSVGPDHSSLVGTRVPPVRGGTGPPPRGSSVRHRPRGQTAREGDRFLVPQLLLLCRGDEGVGLVLKSLSYVPLGRQLLPCVLCCGYFTAMLVHFQKEESEVMASVQMPRSCWPHSRAVTTAGRARAGPGCGGRSGLHTQQPGNLEPGPTPACTQLTVCEVTVTPPGVSVWTM